MEMGWTEMPCPEAVPAVVIVWSGAEPGRVGEVGFFSGEGDELVLGRGDRRPLKFHRQRPGRLEVRPPLMSRSLPEEAAWLRRRGGRLEVEERGDRRLLVNGAPATRASVGPGDTISIEDELVLLVTARSTAMPSMHHRGGGEVAFGEPDEDGIVGESPATWRLRQALTHVASFDDHLLVTGEAGAGKLFIADRVHARSRRASGPVVTCASRFLSPDTSAQALFGHVANLVRAGDEARSGLLAQARAGRLVLDEAETLPRQVQCQLHRVLDRANEYKVLGEDRPRTADVRITALVNGDESVLERDFEARFTLTLAVPSLAERRDDIPMLVRHFVMEGARRDVELARFVRRSGDRSEVLLRPELVDALVRHTYESNVRDLEALVRRSADESHGAPALKVPSSLQG